MNVNRRTQMHGLLLAEYLEVKEILLYRMSRFQDSPLGSQMSYMVLFVHFEGVFVFRNKSIARKIMTKS